MQTIAIIDYGMGNLHSAAKAVAKVADNTKVQIARNKTDIAKADRIIFPGVGAMRDCMKALHEMDLVNALLQALYSKPVLAICVGMQALLDYSEENNGVECLGFWPGRVRLINGALAPELKIPHMGWDQVKQEASHPLWRDIPDLARFYFVHSYCVELVEIKEIKESADVIGSVDYAETFPCALAHENVCAVQFHPEKSQHHGLKLLDNFVRWSGDGG